MGKSQYIISFWNIQTSMCDTNTLKGIQLSFFSTLMLGLNLGSMTLSTFLCSLGYCHVKCVHIKKLTHFDSFKKTTHKLINLLVWMHLSNCFWCSFLVSWRIMLKVIALMEIPQFGSRTSPLFIFAIVQKDHQKLMRQLPKARESS